MADDDEWHASARAAREAYAVSVQQMGALKPGADETGGWLWPAARVLDQALAEHMADLSGKRVLELGAGCGWLALRCARRGAHVTATDKASNVPLLLRNVTRNQERCRAADGMTALDVECCALDWHDAAELPGCDWDWVVGSDIVYLHEDHEALLQLLLRCCRARSGSSALPDAADPNTAAAAPVPVATRCFISFEERFPAQEEHFLRRVDELGFQVLDRVREPGVGKNGAAVKAILLTLSAEAAAARKIACDADIDGREPQPGVAPSLAATLGWRQLRTPLAR